jgi:hypothetical protein
MEADGCLGISWKDIDASVAQIPHSLLLLLFKELCIELENLLGQPLG